MDAEEMKRAHRDDCCGAVFGCCFLCCFTFPWGYPCLSLNRYLNIDGAAAAHARDRADINASRPLRFGAR